MAPEMFQSEIGHSFEVDVWDFGVILYVLLSGTTPFDHGQTKQMY